MYIWCRGKLLLLQDGKDFALQSRDSTPLSYDYEILNTIDLACLQGIKHSEIESGIAYHWILYVYILQSDAYVQNLYYMHVLHHLLGCVTRLVYAHVFVVIAFIIHS